MGRACGGLRLLNSYWIAQARPPPAPRPSLASRATPHRPPTALQPAWPSHSPGSTPRLPPAPLGPQDSLYKYYECIMIDPMHKCIREDPRINWLCNPVHKHRELRGQTSAGRQGRGLRTRNHGASKLRPSWRAAWKKNNTLSLKRYR